MHIRRWTQLPPIARQSSQPSAPGLTSLITSRCVQTGIVTPPPSREALRVEAGDVAHLVHRVQRRNLVGLGQGGVVEDRVDEVVDGATAAHHRLTDVDQLGGAGPEDVYAEKL